MNEFRLESNFATASSERCLSAAEPQNWPAVGHRCSEGLASFRPGLVLGLCLWAFLLAPPPANAVDNQVKSAANPAKAPRAAYRLTITVRNPRCPACLKTLKTYLLALNGVRGVSFDSITGKSGKVEITVKLGQAAKAKRVIERIKAHDLEVLATKCAQI
jgi:hypothetical protein